MLRIVVLVVLVLFAPAVSAWSAPGHRMVGDLAARQLTPGARAAVATLLAGEAEPTLAGVANWADNLRDDGGDAAAARRTQPWHYVNFRGGSCRYEFVRDCPFGNCVVGAIVAQRALLADPRQEPATRRDALKFLVHMVGDVHQPLHASNRDDRGGNSAQLRLRTDLVRRNDGGRRDADGMLGSNLHAVWDYYVLASARLDERAHADLLARRGPTPAGKVERSPAAWAQESCAVIDRHGLYPTGRVVDERYLAAMRPLAEQRISAAAARLAALLNEVLDPRAATAPTTSDPG